MFKQKSPFLASDQENPEDNSTSSEAASAQPLQSSSLSSFVGRQYQVVYADPPWHFKTRSKTGQDRSPCNKYRTMSVDEIAAMPIPEIAAKNAVLFLWVYGPLFDEAFKVISAWGFQYKTTAFNWIKITKSTPHRPRLGLGFFTRKQSEICLLGTRGKPPRPMARGVPEVILAPRREHSRKPNEAYKRIEQMYGGPRIELFARSTRPGWDCFGDEISKFGNTNA
jgi:N6-adenosine-specific RNA methylase IME4